MDVEPLPSWSLRAYLEAAAEQLGMTVGRHRLELLFEHGRLREWRRHEEPIAAGLLERIPAPEEPGGG